MWLRAFGRAAAASFGRRCIGVFRPYQKTRVTVSIGFCHPMQVYDKMRDVFRARELNRLRERNAHDTSRF